MIATASFTGHPGYTQLLPRAAQSAVEARGLIRAALATWGMDELAESAALVVSELVGNAVEHTSCRLIKLSVTRNGRHGVQVAVLDKSQTMPVRQAPNDDEVRGRGLLVVAALTTRWGIDLLPCGKRVWGELVSESAQ